MPQSRNQTPGAVHSWSEVENYEKVGENLFNMDLVLNGRVVPCDGEIKRLRNIADQAFIDKVKAQIPSVDNITTEFGQK
jgi:hypothetical protein